MYFTLSIHPFYLKKKIVLKSCKANRAHIGSHVSSSSDVTAHRIGNDDA